MLQPALLSGKLSVILRSIQMLAPFPNWAVVLQRLAECRAIETTTKRIG